MRKSERLVKAAVTVCAFSLFSAGAMAQTKSDASLDIALSENDRVRVVVVTRSDPELPGGGESFIAPSSYVAARVGDGTTNIRQIGQLQAVSAEIDANALSALRSDPNVALIVEDVPVPPVLFDSVRFIAADKFHENNVLGTELSVAVLDTGIESAHAAFVDGIVAEACFSTESSSVYNLRSLCPNRLDMSLLAGAAGGCPADVALCDHGTHVAGIIAGHGMSFDGHSFSGVSPAARVLPVQVFTLFEDEAVCGTAVKCIRSFTSDQLRALEWVYKRRDDFKIAAVNMSLGGGYRDQYCDNASPLTQTIEKLSAAGILTVVAAGNSRFFDGVSEPACISSVISVSATTKAGGLDVGYSNVSSSVDIAAPGTDIVSSVFNGTYAAYSGTSMAAPHVAGAIALLRQQFPDATALELETILKTSEQVVEDPRTGTKLIRLALAFPEGQMSEPPEPPEPPVVSSAAEPVAQTSRFIIQSQEPEAELRSVLEAACPDFACDLREIGTGQFLLETTPRGDLDPRAAKPGQLDRQTIQCIFADKEIKVFTDKLFMPVE